MRGNFGKIFAHAWKTRKSILICALIGIILLTIIIRPWNEGPWAVWWGWLEPLTGILTLAVAILVWYEEMAHGWEESLPKKLTASFFFKDWLVLRCEKAYLPSESDIRAWSQQLGRQMNNDTNLKFEPFITQYPGEKDNSKEFKLYRAEYTLTELPIAYKARHKREFGEDITEENFLETVGKVQIGSIHWSHDSKTGLKEDWRPSLMRMTPLPNND